MSSQPYPLPEDTSYGYYVSKPACIAFIVLFGTSTFLHVTQAFVHRTHWLLWTAVLCGITELFGWSARLWSSIDPLADDAFIMQISTTIIAPTFLIAANFIILGRIIALVGPQYSRLPPKWYSIIFLTADFIALVVQAVGGAMASIADTHDGAEQGARIMLGGIGLQFAALVIYTLLATEFLIRVVRDAPVRESNLHVRREVDIKVKTMILGLIVSAVLLFIRTIYRTVELTDGWNGSIITNQALFNFLDGLPITAAMFTLNVLHPGRLIYNKDRVEPSQSGDMPLKSSMTSREGLMPVTQV